MSDYMYLLESHLNADQNRVVAEVNAAATGASVNVFLSGGALRDMLGGHPIRDLDFTLETNPAKVVKTILSRLPGSVLFEEDNRRYIELSFPGGVTAQIAMAREERYAKPGGRPHVTPATVYEDLKRRDFTVNAMALSLNRGSRGLLIDPTNGQADLLNRQIRSAYSNALYDDPSRLLRLVRLRHRLGFTVEERTARQFENALSENLQRLIPSSKLLEELRQLGDESAPSEVLEELKSNGLLALFMKPAVAAKLNFAGLGKLEKLKRSVPHGTGGWSDGWRSFLHVLTEKLSPRERNDLFSSLSMPREDADRLRKLESHAAKLETELRSPALRKPSHVFNLLNAAASDEILLILYESQQRIVQDRIRNYLEKYLPMSQEITDEEIGVLPGTPKYQKVREEFVTRRLDARPKKPDTAAELPDNGARNGYGPPIATRGRAAR